ncbi:GroES-like protein [Irpex rosettiformis]|uniref:GroES-like protein n=1 Tax=Irpex rosettiformis TaxID=378272 RepID=A0ACB8UJG2_9APHY|nr:GroES-like protein [Irpex rosettiformis]
MSTIPDKQTGLLSTKEEIKFQEFPVPSPGPNEVLIQNVAVASNPKDWKIPQWVDGYSGVEGNDVAGYVVKVGEGVTEFKGGERVAAFTKMMTQDPKSGAYIQYSVAPASTTFPIPESTSFEEAATLPLALATAFLGLFKRLALPETSSGESKGVIINGASSSVGAFAVQLAKRAGLFVIGVAGSSKDYATSLGADIIVDYRENRGEALADALVKASSGHQISHVFDAVSQDGSTLLLARVLVKISPNGKGKVTYVLFLTDEESKQLPAGIEAEQTAVSTAYGEDEEFAARWYRQVGQWLAPSATNPAPFQPNRVKVLPNGLASVPEGLKLLREGKVHGEKLVYRITETPQLKSS